MLKKHIQSFLINKFIIGCSVAGTIFLSILEHYIVGNPNDYIQEVSERNISFWFSLINVLSYMLFIWAASSLIAKTFSIRYLSKRTVLLSFLKAVICVAWWFFVGIWFLKKLSQFGAIQFTGTSVFSLSAFGLIVSFFLTCFIVCYCYIMFISIFLGSILRTYLRRHPEKHRPWLTTYHLPVSCVWLAFKLPMLWLILTVAFSLKLLGLILLSANVSYIYLITEPLVMLAILFSFHIAIVVYFERQKEQALANSYK